MPRPRRTMIDDRQTRRRALDPFTSFIVQAPAGSGKTALLIDRYLTLLARAESPESIVAITFTKKAAGEMRTRVLQALNAGNAQIAEAALRRDAEAGWHLLANPS